MSNAYLTLTSGARAGSHYSLDPDGENTIGRGLDCRIILTDPLSSRVHAALSRDEEGSWWLRDAESRNGTFLDGQKIDEVRLVDAARFRIGSCEFDFHVGRLEPSDVRHDGIDLTQTLVFDAPVNPADDDPFAASMGDEEHSPELVELYRLAIRLLGCTAPDDVIDVALDSLRQRTRASLAGFLWISEEGELRPQQGGPQGESDESALSESLTKMVSKQGRAVWVSEHASRKASDSLSHYADAICVPLVRDQAIIGAVHLYRNASCFSQTDFEMAISVANILTTALTRARELMSLKVDHERVVAKSAAFDELIGESKPMEDLKGRISRVAKASGCVLVRGESGCGKELVARAIHKASPRADRPLLSVNCAAIPHNLMESQLFGHKKGAFTGAENDHVGWFQQADAGTLFLDEVGEMTLEGQAKLLRILEGHPFLPVGGHEEISVDVRVIAATNRDLREFVRDRKFREDLYYRLSVFELYIPPLRERGTDVGQLVDFFLDHFRRQHGRPELGLSEASREKLLAYQWPGNVRQLRNVIDSAVVLADGESIETDDLGLRDIGGDRLESLRIEDWERKLVTQALSRTGGNVADAAKLLGIGRATLYRKIEEFGIER